MTGLDITGLILLFSLGLGFVAHLIPASRSMRAHLIARAGHGASALQYARQVVNRPKVSLLDYVGALQRIDRCRERDWQDQMLSEPTDVRGNGASSAPQVTPKANVVPFRN